MVSTCSFGNGPVPFSPTVPVVHAVDSSTLPHGSSILFADSTWSAPSLKIAPSKAMLHSLILPGWGQIDNGKKKKAALFITAELICIGGYLYENYRIKHETLSKWDKDRLRTDRNSFIIYWMVSKLLGIVDAYVDAHLANFDVTDITPEDLRK